MTYKFNSAKLLVVDDMLPMQTLLRSLLGLFGFKEIEVAENGQDGFKKLCKFDPDVVLVDWMMEPMDGIEMTEKIRNDPMSPNRFVPVILMTGFSSRLRVERARDIGITEFLVKPFTARDLYEKIEHVIERPRQFVDSRNFFGPDRRRKRDDDYDGPHRRMEDFEKEKNKLTSSQSKAQKELLSQLRNDLKNI
jgi:CheY-like chemotaxis protein